jgi:hypothetical protein
MEGGTTSSLHTIATKDVFGSATMMNISCLNIDSGDSRAVCDVTGMNSKIHQFTITASITQNTLTLAVDPTTGIMVYEKYEDAYGWNIVSHPNYIAIVTTSFQDKFNRVLVYKRADSTSNNTFVYYSLDLNDIIGNRNPFSIGIGLYDHPLTGITKLIVLDYVSNSIAKIFNITNMTIQINALGYYEQLRMQNVSLAINKNYIVSFSNSIFNIFFNPNLPASDRDTRDKKSINYFWDYFGIWLIIFILAIIIGFLVMIFLCRREKVSDYTGST